MILMIYLMFTFTWFIFLFSYCVCCFAPKHQSKSLAGVNLLGNKPDSDSDSVFAVKAARELFHMAFFDEHFQSLIQLTSQVRVILSCHSMTTTELNGMITVRAYLWRSKVSVYCVLQPQSDDVKEGWWENNNELRDEHTNAGLDTDSPISSSLLLSWFLFFCFNLFSSASLSLPPSALLPSFLSPFYLSVYFRTICPSLALLFFILSLCLHFFILLKRKKIK